MVKIRAARTGKPGSAVVEESLRRDLKLDVLDELRSNTKLSEAKATELALEAHHLADGDLVRAVLDPNVLISAVLSSRGASAELLRGGRDGAFELIVSRLLLAEPDRAVAYPKSESGFAQPRISDGQTRWLSASRDESSFVAESLRRRT